MLFLGAIARECKLMSCRPTHLHGCLAMDYTITEDDSAEQLMLLMLYTGARAMDGPPDDARGRARVE